jgi:hypothetical protein
MKTRTTPLEDFIDELEIRGFKLPLDFVNHYLQREEDAFIEAYDEGKKDGILNDEDVNYWGEQYYIDTYGE